jgi:hypothetical protein
MILSIKLKLIAKAALQFPIMLRSLGAEAKNMKTEMLLQKLQAESEARFRTEWKTRNQEIVRRNVRSQATQPSKTDQRRAQLVRLKRLTAEIQNELRLEQQVENEFQRYVEARKERSRKRRKPFNYWSLPVSSLAADTPPVYGR